MIQFLLFRPLFDALHQYKQEDEGGAVWQQHGTEIPWQPFVPVASSYLSVTIDQNLL